MARSDLLLSLARAACQGDKGLARRSVEAIVADERAKQHHVFADRLAACLESPHAHAQRTAAVQPDDVLRSLLSEVSPRVTFDDLVLPEPATVNCRELVEEHHRGDLLRAHGLEPRHRVLLVGPPGNGKTSLAEALASGLMVPLLRVRYDAVVGSYLGETAGRLRRVFDHVRSRHCVLFFDEFDTLGKERSDPHDTGEIKRVVSSLLLLIDDLPSYVVVVTATNHPEILDRAVWRRFQVRVDLPRPGQAQRAEWFARFQGRTNSPLGQTPNQLARAFDGASFSDLREFGDDVLRRWILGAPAGSLAHVVAEQVGRWKARAVSAG